MSSESKASAAADTGEAAETAEGNGADGVEAPEPAVESHDGAEDLASLRSALELAQEQIADLEDRALRAAAEAENVRRRADRSIENARKFALERFVEDLLPAVDSFEKAVDAAAGHGEGEAASPVAAMAEGIELSLKLLRGAMERQGIAVVDPIGAPFDPNLHEAMTMVDNPEVEPNTVIEVFQKGYTVNGRLTRPARVIVARQPPAPAQAEAAGPEAEGPEADPPETGAAA